MKELPEESVTVVLGSYNQAPYIAQALASYTAQDHHDLRLIVTDDASTDDSVHVIKGELAARRLTATTIFHEVNTGICATFNEALEQVETPFVAFLAADDWMDPRRISLQVKELLHTPEAAIVYSDGWIVQDDGSAPDTLFSTISAKDWWIAGSQLDLYAALVRSNWIPAPSVLCRTEALRKVGGYDESMPYEDYDMWLRLAARGHPFAFVDEPLVYYRRTADTNTERIKRLSAVEQDLMDLQILGKQLGTEPTVDSWLSPQLLHTAVVNYKRGSRSPLIARTVRRCFWVRPSFSALVYAVLTSLTQERPKSIRR